MTERLPEQAALLVSTVSLQHSLERRKQEIANHRANLAATTQISTTQLGKPPPVPTYGASRIQSFLQKTEQLSAVHATIALSGAVSRYKMAARAASLPDSRDEVTATAYSLAAAEAKKADAVALEGCLDGQRRDMVTRIYHLEPQQRRMLSSASPTRHVARLGAGPVPGGSLAVPPRRPAAWKDAYPQLSTQAAAQAERSAERRRSAAAAQAQVRAAAQAQDRARSAEASRRAARLLQTQGRPSTPTAPGQTGSASPAGAAAAAEPTRTLTRPSSAPQLVRTPHTAPNDAARPGSAKASLAPAAPHQHAPLALHAASASDPHAAASCGVAITGTRRAAPTYAPPPSTASCCAGSHPATPPLPPAPSILRLLGGVRWRPAPSSPALVTTMARSSSADALASSTACMNRTVTASAPTNRDMPTVCAPAWASTAASSAMAGVGVSAESLHSGLGGAVGEAIAAELEGRAAMAHSERLIIDNERMRKEAEALLLEREQEEQVERGGEDAAFLATTPSPADSPTAPAPGAGVPAADAAAADAACCLTDSSATSAVQHGEPRMTRASDAHKRRQRAAKARRVMREAVKMRLATDSSASVGQWSLAGLDLSKLATVALEIAKISEALRTSDFFSDLGERQLAMMASAGQRRKLGRYSVVYREAAISTCFYVLIGGSLLEHSLTPTWKQPELKPGERRPKDARRDRRMLTCDRRAGCTFTLFGMEAVVGRPRASTISVIGSCELLKFPAANLNIRRDGADKIARKVFNAFLEGELAATTAFKNLPPKALKQVVPLLMLEEHDAGTTLYTPGNPGDKVFIVMHGSVTILRSSTPIATLTAEQGQATSTDFGMPMFGYMALIDRNPRHNTAVVASDAKLLVLPLESWAACTMAVPDIKARLRRLRWELG